MLGRLILCAAIIMVPAAASATEYHFCISSDRRPANMIVKSGPVDFGREWYRAKAGQDFCNAVGAHGCSVSNFDTRTCGSLRQEQLTYTGTDGDTMKVLFSGNPATMGQFAVEVVTGVPVKVGRKVCK